MPDELDRIIKIAIVVVFFVLPPVIKAITESRKKQREHEARTRREARAPTGAEDRGRAAWEALLRGEPLEQQPPPKPPPPARPAPPVAPEAPYAPELGERIERAPRRALSSEGLSAEGREVLTESDALTKSRPLTASEPLTGAQPLTESAALDTGPSLTESPAFEGETLADLVRAGRYDVLTPSAPGRAVPARRLSPTTGEWRRAIVLAEVLAPPVSLRRTPIGVPPVAGGAE